MLVRFFFELRSAGITVSITEFLALLLLAQPLPQGLEQLLPTAERCDATPVLRGECSRGERLQPLGRHGSDELRKRPFGTLEDVGKHLIEAVVMALVLHQTGARQVVEVLS